MIDSPDNPTLCHCLRPRSSHFDEDNNFNYICATYTPLCGAATLYQFIGNTDGTPHITPFDEFDIYECDVIDTRDTYHTHDALTTPSTTSTTWKICKTITRSKNNPRGLQLWANFGSAIRSAVRVLELIHEHQDKLRAKYDTAMCEAG